MTNSAVQFNSNSGMAASKRILSGIQPTGVPTLGNYLGALRNWVKLQHQTEHASQSTLFYASVDLHAMSGSYTPKEAQQSHQFVYSEQTCGLDTQRCSIFRQSAVREHTELSWLLTCITPMGWLNRMTQFKAKAGKDREYANLGLYAYPVLQAADILLYKSTHVPVGEDQLQHLELANRIATTFNHKYGAVFNTSEPILSEEGTRVMDLRDGTKKMSKSAKSDMSRINLTDSADLIAKKIMKAKTDNVHGFRYNKAEFPEKSNLMEIFAALSETPITDVQRTYEDASAAEFKRDLAELCVTKISPIGNEINRLLDTPEYLEALCAAGAEQAREVACSTMVEVRAALGYV